jgi:hypothetical protein
MAIINLCTTQVDVGDCRDMGTSCLDWVLSVDGWDRPSVADGSAGLFRFFCDNFLNKLCKIMKIIMEVG